MTATDALVVFLKTYQFKGGPGIWDLDQSVQLCYCWNKQSVWRLPNLSGLKSSINHNFKRWGPQKKRKMDIWTSTSNNQFSCHKEYYCDSTCLSGWLWNVSMFTIQDCNRDKAQVFFFFLTFLGVNIRPFWYNFRPQCNRENKVRAIVTRVRKVWVVDGSKKRTFTQETGVCIPCETKS